MKNRLFYAEFGDADAAPAAAADEKSRKKVSDAFRVSFDNSQKKFFGLVRDGIFALLALVLFALSFAPRLRDKVERLFARIYHSRHSGDDVRFDRGLG